MCDCAAQTWRYDWLLSNQGPADHMGELQEKYLEKLQVHVMFCLVDGYYVWYSIYNIELHPCCLLMNKAAMLGIFCTATQNANAARKPDINATHPT